jgi:hypothetical protein
MNNVQLSTTVKLSITRGKSWLLREFLTACIFSKLLWIKRQFDNGVKIRVFFIAIDENIMYDAWTKTTFRSHCYC